MAHVDIEKFVKENGLVIRNDKAIMWWNELNETFVIAPKSWGENDWMEKQEDHYIILETKSFNRAVRYMANKKNFADI